jgi:hypothetical protein
MKKTISILLIFVFIFTIYAWSGEQSGEASGESSANVTGKTVILILAITLVSLLIIAAFGGFASTKISQSIAKNKKKDKEKKEMATLFNEITSPTALTPNLEIIAKMYNLTTEEVKSEISKLVSRGELDIEKSLQDNSEAVKAMKIISESLKNKAMSENRFNSEKLQKVKKWFKDKAKEGKDLTLNDILHITKLLTN